MINLFNIFKKKTLEKTYHTIQKIPNGTIGVSCKIENYADVLQYICKDIKRSILLTSQSDEKLKELFGDHSTRYKGIEFKYKIWVVQYGTETFEIYASKRGMDIAIVAKHDEDKTEVIIDFLHVLEERLKSLNEQ